MWHQHRKDKQMLKRTRIALATVVFALIMLLFLDISGTLHTWLSWLAMIQFVPALLALNVGIIVALIVLTLIFGRIYCSVICPLGVMQDIISNIHSRRKRNRFSHSPEKRIMRYTFLVIFIASFVAGAGAVVALLSPYSSYGRIATNIFQPLWATGNNVLALIAERADSYSFYSVDVWIRSLPTFIIAAASFVVIACLAWSGGRTYCNTVCPVGTILGFIARLSLLKVHIDKDKCNGCGLCARNCKASCINAKEHEVDYSRCVVCGNCIGKCRKGAISYRMRMNEESKGGKEELNRGRRSFLLASAIATTSAMLAQEKKKVDGGLAKIEDKIAPERNTPITPPGSITAQNMARRCTACQLCVSECPNGVLHPSTDLMHLMQPTMSFERGYCRPECTRCSDVCPTGAIKPITREDKTAIHIGHAVWIRKNCIPLVNGDACGNCARHCPAGAILMVSSNPKNPNAPKIPAVNTVKCIGCGACENLCPARPFSAIYVEGNENHVIN